MAAKDIFRTFAADKKNKHPSPGRAKIIMAKEITLNKGAKQIGMVISAYTQGNQWIANVTNDSIDYWYEIKLHYSISTKQDVIDWATAYAQDDDCECVLRF